MDSSREFRAVSSLKSVCHRFPVEVIIASVGAIAFMIATLPQSIWHRSSEAYNYYAMHIALTSALLLGVVLATTIIYETKRINQAVRWSLFVLSAELTWWFVSGLEMTDSDEALYACALVAAHILIVMSGMINRDRIGFWLFNKALLFRLLVGLFYSFLLLLGVGIAVTPFMGQIGLGFGLWLMAFSLVLIPGWFNVVYVLGGIPPTPDIDAESKYYSSPDKPDTQQFYIMQSMVTRIIILSVCVLYAYAATMLLIHDSSIEAEKYVLWILALSGLGYLFLYPERNSEEHRWLRRCYRCLGVMIFPLSMFLWYIIIERVELHGITESRALVILLAGFFTCMGAYTLVKRDVEIRVIPVVALVFALAGFILPWNIASVSYMSQTSRLNAILERHGSIVKGRYHERADMVDVSPDELAQLTSILNYLDDYKGHVRINAWLADIGASFRRSGDVFSVYEPAGREILHRLKIGRAPHPRLATSDLGDRVVVTYDMFIDRNALALPRNVPSSSMHDFHIHHFIEAREDSVVFDVSPSVQAMIYRNNPFWLKLSDAEGNVSLLNTQPLLFESEYGVSLSPPAAQQVPPEIVLGKRRVTLMFKKFEQSILQNKGLNHVMIEGVAIIRGRR